MAFLTEQQLAAAGFKEYGKNVLISDKASIYGAANISFGSNVRIDDFCIISATDKNTAVKFGSYIHMGCYSSIIGKGNCTISDFCNISSKVAIYTSNDDYSGAFLTNPMVDPEFTNVSQGDVFMDKHVIIGSGCVVLPHVKLHQGVSIGALSLVNKDCEEFGIFAGTPIKFLKKRKTDLLEKEVLFLKSRKNES